MKNFDFNKEYNNVLEKGLEYLTKTFTNVSYDPDNILIIGNYGEFEKPVRIPTGRKRFLLIKMHLKDKSTKKKKNSNFLLLDNEKKLITYLCVNDLQWCKVNPLVVQRTFEKLFGKDFKVDYLPIKFTSPIKDANHEFLFKTEFKNLMWNLFWTSLKLQNPNFSNFVLEEYYLINVKKRSDLKDLLINFFEKINK